MTSLTDLPTTYIMLMQKEPPTKEKMLELGHRYLILGYKIVTPLNVREITYKTTSKTDTRFFAIEVRKEQ